MDMVNIKINDKEYSVPASYTILDAARDANIHIPTLCYLKDLNQIGACRMCLVEIKGARALQAACVYPVAEGMEVITNDDELFETRKTVLELILSNHPNECLTCIRSGHCELQDLANTFAIESTRLPSLNKKLEKDE